MIEWVICLHGQLVKPVKTGGTFCPCCGDVRVQSVQSRGTTVGRHVRYPRTPSPAQYRCFHLARSPPPESMMSDGRIYCIVSMFGCFSCTNASLPILDGCKVMDGWMNYAVRSRTGEGNTLVTSPLQRAVDDTVPWHDDTSG